VAANTATMETTVTAITAAVTTTASNDNANPRSNVQAHPRKANYRQLPLNKHRPSTVYYTQHLRHIQDTTVRRTLHLLRML
jgi:hypothetical protein